MISYIDGNYKLARLIDDESSWCDGDDPQWKKISLQDWMCEYWVNLYFSSERLEL